jgi:hypothetical protein
MPVQCCRSQAEVSRHRPKRTARHELRFNCYPLRMFAACANPSHLNLYSFELSRYVAEQCLVCLVSIELGGSTCLYVLMLTAGRAVDVFSLAFVIQSRRADRPAGQRPDAVAVRSVSWSIISVVRRTLS